MSHALRCDTSLSASPLSWDECDCPLCGSHRWRPWLEAPDRSSGGEGLWFMIVRCGECGLCFTNPRPSPDAMARFERRAESAPALGRSEDKMRWWHRLPGCANMRRYLRRHGRGRLLDVGCGSGDFVLRMRRQGWEATGLEPDFGRLDRLRERQVPVLAGSLNWTPIPERSFDVITIWNHLERERDPLEYLRRAWHLLAPGGKLVVRTPNVDSLSFRWLGSAWAGLDLPRRLVHFTPATLRLMLMRAGFDSIQVRMQRRASWMRQSARFAARQPNASKAAWLHGKTLSHLASWYAHFTRQSDVMLAIAVKNG